jgi:peptidoglycan/LPS O-acetylase OafA/YrhL
MSNVATANDDTELYEAEEKQHFRFDIQGLRALAVILGHAKAPHFTGGYIGVDVFFVISGFVITGLLLRQAQGSVLRNLGKFYSRRIRRIMPAATLVMIGTALAAYQWLGPFSAVPILADLHWASLFGANFHLIHVGQDYFSQGLPPSLLTHYWSLAVEEQFYFVFPLILFVLGAIVGLRRHRVTLSGILVAIVAASAIWSVMATNANPISAYFSPLTRFWELGFGALLASLPASLQIKNKIVVAVGGWIALAVIIAAAMTLPDTSGVAPGWKMWLAVAPTGFLLFSGGTSSLWAPSGWFSRQPLKYIGDISYSLYLFHFAWLNVPLQYAQLKYGITTELSGTSRVLQVLGALACAVASYHLFENPIRRSKWLDRHPQLTALLGAALIGLTWLTAYLLGKYWTI